MAGSVRFLDAKAREILRNAYPKSRDGDAGADIEHDLPSQD